MKNLLIALALSLAASARADDTTNTAPVISIDLTTVEKRDLPSTVELIEAAEVPTQYGSIAIAKGTKAVLVGVKDAATINVKHEGTTYPLNASKTDLQSQIEKSRAKRITINGTEYSNFEFSDVTTTDAKLTSQSGVVRVKLVSLPEEWRTKLGYDEGKVRRAEARAKVAKAEQDKKDAEKAAKRAKGEIDPEERAAFDKKVCQALIESYKPQIQDVKLQSSTYSVNGKVYFATSRMNIRSSIRTVVEEIHGIYKGGVDMDAYVPSAGGEWVKVARGSWSIWSNAIVVKMYE